MKLNGWKYVIIFKNAFIKNFRKKSLLMKIPLELNAKTFITDYIMRNEKKGNFCLLAFTYFISLFIHHSSALMKEVNFIAHTMNWFLKYDGNKTMVFWNMIIKLRLKNCIYSYMKHNVWGNVVQSCRSFM